MDIYRSFSEMHNGSVHILHYHIHAITITITIITIIISIIMFTTAATMTITMPASVGLDRKRGALALQPLTRNRQPSTGQQTLNLNPQPPIAVCVYARDDSKPAERRGGVELLSAPHPSPSGLPLASLLARCLATRNPKDRNQREIHNIFSITNLPNSQT